MMNFDKTQINQYSNIPNSRFYEPANIRMMKERIPVSYLGDISSFRTSLNKSSSNLTKDTRFKTLTTFKHDIPSPSVYNLQYLHSISKNAQISKAKRLYNDFSPKRACDYDRFKDKTYCKELDRKTGGQSPGPCAYDGDRQSAIFPRVRKSRGTLFGKSDRKLKFKKEVVDSPSPTKYDVQYGSEGIRNHKGFTFGSSEKKFAFGLK
jgi:hypothetical protein